MLDWLTRLIDEPPLLTRARHDEIVAALKKHYDKEMQKVALQHDEIQAKTKKDHAAALVTRHAQAHAEGLEQGIERGIEQGKKTLVIRQVKTPPPKPASKWLVREKPWSIDANREAQIRADIERLAPDVKLTPAQWDMVLCRTPACYVIAGAGSGKSTTLVMRVVVLHFYLGVSLNELSVFTFTRNSRHDFICKLIARFQAWGRKVTYKDAKSVVRTFHSMILKMYMQVSVSSPAILELLNKKKEVVIQEEDVDAVENMVAEEASEDLRGRLKLAYENVYREDDKFRAAIAELYRVSLLQQRRNSEDGLAKTAKWVSDLDQQLSEYAAAEWRTRIAPDSWPDLVRYVDLTPRELRLSPTLPCRFTANGYIKDLDTYVVLGGATFFKDALIPGTKEKVALLINSKRKVFMARSEQRVIWIDQPKTLLELLGFLKWNRDKGSQASVPPAFSYTPSGEIQSAEAVHITDTMFAFAQFIENVGIDVSTALERLDGEDLPPADRQFAIVTRAFWRYFEKALEHDQVSAFNQLFAMFSERNFENLKYVPNDTLRAMKHLMIDEFQDISPQIVHWVRACQRELVSRSDAGTFMCVGDDWQSIYGWRGSTPDYFLRFTHHFPAKDHQEIKMEENFRSSQYVIECAETLVAPVKNRSKKRGVAKGELAKANWPVRVQYANGEDLPFDEIIETIDAEVARTQPTEEHPLLVLSRARKLLDKIPKRWGKTVACMTFHASKGLESTTVVLLGDCRLPDANPLKRLVYERAGLGDYDEAQREEALRLAYVAVTRAKERCYWYLKKGQNSASAHLPDKQPFVETFIAQ